MMQLVTRIGQRSRVPVLVAAAAAVATLAAGCATQAAPAAGGRAPAGGGTGTATRIAGSPAPVSATPVPTTIGGAPIVAGKPACSGWPAGAVRGTVPPPSFATAAVLRCAVGFKTIPGKGQWETATLERADRDLAPLLTALHHPSQRRAAGVMCPDIAALAPQFVLVGRDGTAIWPRLPLTGCGQVQSGVLTTLSALPWQTVSVRLITRVR